MRVQVRVGWKGMESEGQCGLFFEGFASGSMRVALSFYLSFLKSADNIFWFSLRG
jgi:hypothetical protein